jgi:hypothetical protein
MSRLLKRILASLLMVTITHLGVATSAHAVLIGTEQVASIGNADERGRLLDLIDRPEVQLRLQDLGISASEAKSRVNALTNEEVRLALEHFDSLPAGGDLGWVLVAAVVVFVVLLITDFLGWTKIFPWTRR